MSYTHQEHAERLNAAGPQPAPTGEGREVYDLVLCDILERYESGKQKYGTSLRVNNGRDPLVDAYQEAVDMVMYLRQAIEERKQMLERNKALMTTLNYIRTDYNSMPLHSRMAIDRLDDDYPKGE